MMPLVRVEILEGRNSDVIEIMMEEVTATIHRTLDSPKENIRVIVHEIPHTHWSIGGHSVRELREDKSR
ncbi:2-hydroxymuconate tautomerase [Shouchella sp. JSM 1781072]|uniref:2-hydroxymuconate tautomerase n=1 Tax=Shouchella sp. JSM 1781072 TaxID=3344581 RepID=UPI0035C10CDA